MSTQQHPAPSELRIVFMGSPAFAVPVLEALVAMPNARVVGVYTQPDKPRGRGLSVEPPPVKRAAAVRGIAVFQPPSLRPPEVQAGLAALRPDVIAVAAYGRLLPPAVLSLPPHACVNVHPSLLPRHRGPAPVVGALLAGDPVTGVTIMLMEPTMDTGPVLAQVEERVRADDTAATLTDRLMAIGARLLVGTLPRWVAGQITPVPQDHAKATVTRLVKREDGRADFSLPATTLERMRRAYTPWPGLYTTWRGKLLHLLDVEAAPAPQDVDPTPGGVVRPRTAIGSSPLLVICGEGVLVLKRLQLEGKRPVSAVDFLNGQQGFLGSRLPDGESSDGETSR